MDKVDGGFKDCLGAGAGCCCGGGEEVEKRPKKPEGAGAVLGCGGFAPDCKGVGGFGVACGLG